MLQRGRLFKNVIRFQRSMGLAKSGRAGQIQRNAEIGPRAVFSKVNPAPASGRTPNCAAPAGAIAEMRFRKVLKHQNRYANPAPASRRTPKFVAPAGAIAEMRHPNLKAHQLRSVRPRPESGRTLHFAPPQTHLAGIPNPPAPKD